MKVLLIFAAFVASVWGRVLPDYFPICKRSDPQLEKCITKSLDDMRSHIINGIPEIKLPPLDPYHLATLKLDKDLQNVHIKAVIRNAIGRGAKDFVIKNVKIHVGDHDNYEGSVTLYFSKIDVAADYEILNANFAGFEDKGSSGKMEGSITDITAKVSGRATTVLKNGEKHLQIEELNTDVTLGNGHVQIHDSKGGAIGDLATVFFNTNPSGVLKELLPIISEVVTLTVKGIVSKIAKKIPLEEILEL